MNEYLDLLYIAAKEGKLFLYFCYLSIFFFFGGGGGEVIGVEECYGIFQKEKHEDGLSFTSQILC